jgi:hypothetical protein
VPAVGAAISLTDQGGLRRPAAAASGLAGAQPQATSPYPPVGPGTNLLDHAALLGDLDEPDWYEANIPFLAVPDAAIQAVYYYRWRVWKEHIRATGTANGEILTEFFGAPTYAAPFGAINASSPHHITEGRWVRDRHYVDDELTYWLRGAGSGPKPATDTFNANQTDWAHEYSFWVATAGLGRAQVTGDFAFLSALLPELVRQYDGWQNQFDDELGLYWQVPVWDGMEYSASSYETDPSDPYHGGAGYRPTINAYQYGDAVAIAALASMTGDRSTARSFRQRAQALQTQTATWLWDPARQFFYHMALDGNPGHQLLSTREEIGFVPWMFGLAAPDQALDQAAAWAQLLDPQGFAAPYGPTTAEQRSQWYLYQASEGCCRWDGPSWPFATSQTLTGLANLLDDYPPQSVITAADYARLLSAYAATQFQNGVPHVGQAHDPSQDDWIYDAVDYSHSTYCDLVISGLVGVRPRSDQRVRIRPLVPATWDWFCLENAPYHGHNLTVVWDRNGAQFHRLPGLTVYVDGREAGRWAGLGDVVVELPPTSPQAMTGLTMANLAVNVPDEGFPLAFASSSGSSTGPANANDGQILYGECAQASEWTDAGAPSSPSLLGVDLGAAVPVSEARYYTWSDVAAGGTTAAPASCGLEYWTGSSWATVPGQQPLPATPPANGLGRILFPALRASQVRLVVADQPGRSSGITELQVGGLTTASRRLWVGNPDTTSLLLYPGTANTVTTTLDGATPVDELELIAPEGWTVTKSAGDPAQTTWSVTPAGIGPGEPAVLYAASQVGGRVVSYGRATVDIGLSLSGYGTVQLDDGFTSDDLSSYTEILPSVTAGSGELQPAWTLGGGLASATATQPYFGVLQSALAPAVPQAVTYVEVGQLLAQAGSQNSFFAGFLADAGNYVMVWYNGVFQTSGIDLVVDGVLDPPGFANYCCASVTLAAGDRLALVLAGNTVSSFAQTGGSGNWTPLTSTTIAPNLDLTDPTTRAGYHYAFGLRGDSGTLAASRLFGAAQS